MLTLPMFVFMGFMLSESGIANDMYYMFHVWMGSLRGGLAVGTLFVMILISCMNGLSVAGMAIGCSVALPELLKRNYDKRMISGLIQAGSSLGILIPPSIVLVLYGMIARQPVSQLWLAGIIPLLLIFSVIGSFFFGFTSLVESSAFGAFAAFIVALCRRRLTWDIFKKILRETLDNSAMFMWVMMAALAFAAVFDGLGAVRALEGLFLNDWGLSPWQVLLLMQLSFVVLGIFLDDTAMLVIVAPLYIPLVVKLGFNPIWFGILYTITCQIAYITPPFGYNLFLMRAMSPKSITIGDIYVSIIPFVGLMLLALVLIMTFPGIALWIPSLFGGNL